ncbi:MAG: substrate-binding domain-containing protein [Desulfobulbaceae bacterium]|nr:substrate-binding domain-containing protein [Desulfobulbaceae bacterium]
MSHPIKKQFFRGLTMIAAGLMLVAPAHAADPVRINGSGSGLHMMKPLIEAYSKAHPEAQFEMEKPLGSSGSIKALKAGVIDIAVSSRALKEDEVKAGLTMEKYGQTPLALVCNQSVSKKAVTTQELVDIFSGKTTNWPDGKLIRLILRPVEDADTKLLRHLSPEMDSAMTSAQARPGMIVAVTDPEAIDAIAKTPGALGASGLTGVIVEHLPLNVLSLNGVEPTPETLAKGSFPFAKALDIVTNKTTLSDDAKKFLAFIYSLEGRKVSAAVGVAITAGEKSPW